MRRGKTGKSHEIPAAAVITASLLLCIIICWADVNSSRRQIKMAAQHAVQAGAEVTQMGEAQVESAFKDYTQLSDPLLVLVNNEVSLPEDWTVTPRMVHDTQVDLRMYDDLMAMFDAAGKDEVWFWVASGYRSVEEQEVILQRAIDENQKLGMSGEKGKEEALRTIARPGYSEHHTGLAVDLNDVSDDFQKTAAYAWLQKHGAEYGFVQRYREDKSAITGIDDESWHYRYVGARHAKEMERLDMCLEEYVIYLKKQGKN